MANVVFSAACRHGVAGEAARPALGHAVGLADNLGEPRALFGCNVVFGAARFAADRGNRSSACM